jgi:integrase/recombinase XerD
MALYHTVTGFGVDWRDEFGQRHRKFVGSQEAAAAVEAQLRQGAREQRTAVETLTAGAALKLSDAAALYLSHVSVSPSTRKKYRLLLDVLVRHVGNLPLPQITAPLLKAYMQERSQQIAPATLALQAQQLRSLFHFLQDQGHTAHDPARLLKYDRPLPVAKLALTYEEERAILESFQERTRLKILLALDAGLRDGEIVHLRRNHLDFTEGLLHVHATKPRTVQLRLVPMTARLQAALERYAAPLAPDSLVVATATRPQGRASGFLYSAKHRLPVLFTMHQLRHTFASRLSALNTNPFVVVKLLGHKPFEMSWRGAQFRLTTPLYVHPSLEELRAAIRGMEAANPNCRDKT